MQGEGCGRSITTEDKTAAVIANVAHKNSVNQSYIQEDYWAVYLEDLLKHL